MTDAKKRLVLAMLLAACAWAPSCTINREYFGVPVTLEAVRLVRNDGSS